jgi:hypothetical protein
MSRRKNYTREGLYTKDLGVRRCLELGQKLHQWYCHFIIDSITNQAYNYNSQEKVIEEDTEIWRNFFVEYRTAPSTIDHKVKLYAFTDKRNAPYFLKTNAGKSRLCIVCIFQLKRILSAIDWIVERLFACLYSPHDRFTPTGILDQTRRQRGSLLEIFVRSWLIAMRKGKKVC